MNSHVRRIVKTQITDLVTMTATIGFLILAAVYFVLNQPLADTRTAQPGPPGPYQQLLEEIKPQSGGDVSGRYSDFVPADKPLVSNNLVVFRVDPKSVQPIGLGIGAIVIFLGVAYFIYRHIAYTDP